MTFVSKQWRRSNVRQYNMLTTSTRYDGQIATLDNPAGGTLLRTRFWAHMQVQALPGTDPVINNWYDGIDIAYFVYARAGTLPAPSPQTNPFTGNSGTGNPDPILQGRLQPENVYWSSDLMYSSVDFRLPGDINDSRAQRVTAPVERLFLHLELLDLRNVVGALLPDGTSYPWSLRTQTAVLLGLH